jgi:hypothetical protein
VLSVFLTVGVAVETLLCLVMKYSMPVRKEPIRVSLDYGFSVGTDQSL